jgi:hypothetical protein
MTSYSRELGLDTWQGLDLTNLDETTQDEINAHLIESWRARQPLYNLYANSLMIDYAPDFAKLHRWGSDFFGRHPANVLMLAVQNMQSYMMLGWETGIRNTFHTLRRGGLTKGQIMEIVMFSQIYAGMRGLGHVYHAAGDMLAVFAEPPGPPTFPEGWAADPDAFKCGLDFSTRELTGQDLKNLTDWYERTIGYVPNSIKFGIKHHPQFVKVNRAKWEVAIKTLPKQFAPYILLRHHTVIGNRDGLREAALLGKAWGITPEWIVLGITGSAMYFTGTEGLYAAYEAVDDLL